MNRADPRYETQDSTRQKPRQQMILVSSFLVAAFPTAALAGISRVLSNAGFIEVGTASRLVQVPGPDLQTCDDV